MSRLQRLGDVEEIVSGLKTLVTAAIILILILITSDCLVPGSGSLSEMKMIADW